MSRSRRVQLFLLLQTTGEAFRAVSGLTLGYVLRPFFRVEQLLWPVYNWATKLIEPSAEYRVREGEDGGAVGAVHMQGMDCTHSDGGVGIVTMGACVRVAPSCAY